MNPLEESLVEKIAHYGGDVEKRVPFKALGDSENVWNRAFIAEGETLDKAARNLFDQRTKRIEAGFADLEGVDTLKVFAFWNPFSIFVRQLNGTTLYPYRFEVVLSQAMNNMEGRTMHRGKLVRYG